jgi:hypothetical protein
MITKAQAKIGVRVKWQSLDASVPPTFGKITASGPAPGLTEREFAVTWNDGEVITYQADNRASRVSLCP